MAATLTQLVAVRSQLAEGLSAYFQMVKDAPNRPETLPAYLGDRTRTALYIEPDVLKRERRNEQDEPTRRDGKASASKPRPVTHFAAEAQDIGDDVMYGERERETERRVAWALERKELERIPASRAVILAPPGQGKSLLTQMTAYDFAEDAWQALYNQRLSVNDIPLPIVVTLNALVAAFHALASDLSRRSTPEADLRDALTVVLRKMSYPETAIQYLVAHAHEQRCWLFLDALDEADDEQAMIKLFTTLKEPKDWQCHLIITSRPYGYAGLRSHMPFAVIEYRLAPLADQQAKTFVEKWFAGRTEQARMNELLARSQSVRNVSQNPFLLTLLCWVTERHELPDNITRTQIYDQVTHDLLGLPLNGVGSVNEQRAKEWLPLMTEIAFTFFEKTGGRKPIPTSDLLELMAASPKRPAPLDLTPAQTANLSLQQQATYLLDELRQKRLLVPLTDKRAAYVPPHRSFLEYFTACALAERANQKGWSAIESLANKKAWRSDWEDALTMLTGKLDDPIPFLELLRNRKRDDYFRTQLCLAARCLPEVSLQEQPPVSNALPKKQQKLRKIIEEITIDVFDLWCKNKVRRFDFPHINQSLPSLTQMGPAILSQRICCCKYFVRTW